MKLGLNCSIGRLGRLPSGRAKDTSGGSSTVGDRPSRGETENAEPLSEMRDGAPSTDSALEVSETDGDGRGVSLSRRDEKVDLMVREFSAGLA